MNKFVDCDGKKWKNLAGEEMPDIKLSKEELLSWFSWLRKVAKETNIWTGGNDELPYGQIREVIKEAEITEVYIDENGIPIHVPSLGLTVTFDSKALVITDYDWNKFLKMDREKQIDVLGFLLEGLKELPKNLEMAKTASPRNAGFK